MARSVNVLKEMAIQLDKDIVFLETAAREKEKLVAELQKKIDEVRTLRGILPICSVCKKIRNDDGYWNQIDVYIREHSEAEFSHGICPKCAEKLYPDIDFKNV